jgi:hypothetical protein
MRATCCIRNRALEHLDALFANAALRAGAGRRVDDFLLKPEAPRHENTFSSALHECNRDIGRVLMAAFILPAAPDTYAQRSLQNAAEE